MEHRAVSLQQLSFLLSAVMQTLCRWIVTIKRNYRPVPGHDWSHAVLTMQSLFVMLQVYRLLFFSARQHICYSALYAIARPSVRPSVCLSVRHTGGSVKYG